MKNPYQLPQTLAVSHTAYPDRTITYDGGMERPVLQDFSHIAKQAYKKEAERVQIRPKMKLVKSKTA